MTPAARLESHPDGRATADRLPPSNTGNRSIHPMNQQAKDPPVLVAPDNAPYIIEGAIWVSPTRMGGQPCIRDSRIPVEYFLHDIADGCSIHDYFDQSMVDSHSLMTILLTAGNLITRIASQNLPPHFSPTLTPPENAPLTLEQVLWVDAEGPGDVAYFRDTRVSVHGVFTALADNAAFQDCTERFSLDPDVLYTVLLFATKLVPEAAAQTLPHEPPGFVSEFERKLRRYGNPRNNMTAKILQICESDRSR